MLDRNKINMLQAAKFDLVNITTSLSNPRMLIMIFGHKSFGSNVRVKVLYKENQSGRWEPEYDVTTMDSGYEVLEAAKKTFENKAVTFININRLQYHGRKK